MSRQTTFVDWSGGSDDRPNASPTGRCGGRSSFFPASPLADLGTKAAASRSVDAFGGRAWSQRPAAQVEDPVGDAEKPRVHDWRPVLSGPLPATDRLTRPDFGATPILV